MNIFLQPDFLKDTPSVSYGFFGRQGGVSDGIYGSLNCGEGSGDDLEAVHENRTRVAVALEVDWLLSLYQIHSATCLDVTAPWMHERPQADAMVTDVPGIALGILTADCAPVLFTGKKADGTPVIGAAHAGWKGALGGILESTVRMMSEKGAQMETIRACVGPCIGKASYEVGAEFLETFLNDNEENERFFGSAQRADHYMFDLPGYCAARLSQVGLKNISLMDRDTYSNEQDFYSYRRKTHRGEEDYGRQISAIAIKK